MLFCLCPKAVKAVECDFITKVVTACNDFLFPERGHGDIIFGFVEPSIFVANNENVSVYYDTT